MSDKDRLGPPPIEPMTNAAWSRVERGLFERLDRPLEQRPARRALPRWPWIAIPAFAVAAAALVILAVVVRGSSGTEVVLAPAAPIEPSRVVAGDTPSMVSYGDAHLTVEAHSAIVMGREDRSPSVLVERGAVEFTVAPRGRDPFVVRAGDVVVRVVGTQFRVARYEERVTVAVERGLVDVQFRGEMHRLASGQTWSTPEQTAQTAPTPPIDTTTPPTTDKPADASPRPGKAASGKSVGSAGPATDASVDDERAKFERASSLELRAPEQAITGYLEVSKGSSKWAAVALYSAGRLAFDRKDKRARMFLDIYLRRFPRGANAEDARVLLSRLGANQ